MVLWTTFWVHLSPFNSNHFLEERSWATLPEPYFHADSHCLCTLLATQYQGSEVIHYRKGKMRVIDSESSRWRRSIQKQSYLEKWHKSQIFDLIWIDLAALVSNCVFGDSVSRWSHWKTRGAHPEEWMDHRLVKGWHVEGVIGQNRFRSQVGWTQQKPKGLEIKEERSGWVLRHDAPRKKKSVKLRQRYFVKTSPYSLRKPTYTLSQHGPPQARRHSIGTGVATSSWSKFLTLRPNASVVSQITAFPLV